MEIVAATIALGAAIIGATLLKLLASEVEAWLPSLARRLLEEAARRLPQSARERYREEWLAHLHECPGKLGQLTHAFGCLVGARRVMKNIAADRDETNQSSDLSVDSYLAMLTSSKDPLTALSLTKNRVIAIIRSDPNHAEALGIYAHICVILEKDFDSAEHYFDRSLTLNPSLAQIWGLSAVNCCCIGEPDDALRRLEHYRAIAPFDTYMSFFEDFYPAIHMYRGDYAQAAFLGRRLVALRPTRVSIYKPLIAALGLLGKQAEAEPYLKQLQELEPNFTVQAFQKSYPFKYTKDRDRYLEGLRRAGVPEV